MIFYPLSYPNTCIDSFSCIIWLNPHFLPLLNSLLWHLYHICLLAVLYYHFIFFAVPSYLFSALFLFHSAPSAMTYVPFLSLFLLLSTQMKRKPFQFVSSILFYGCHLRFVFPIILFIFDFQLFFIFRSAKTRGIKWKKELTFSLSFEQIFHLLNMCLLYFISIVWLSFPFSSPLCAVLYSNHSTGIVPFNIILEKKTLLQAPFLLF